MKRILIFSTSYSPLWGGAEIALKEITDRLKSEDFCFDMVTMRHDKTLPKFEKIGKINVHRVSSSKLLFSFSAYFKALSLHRKNKYDIAWSMMAGRNGFAALFFKLTKKEVRFLLTLQEGDRLSYPKERAGALWFAVGGLFKKVFTKADSIQVISKYLETWARDIGYEGEIELVPNGADIEKFQTTKHRTQIEELKKELGIEDGEKVIITTGRLVEKNAVEDIVRALTFLPDNYKLLIAGTGELFYELRKLTDELQLTKRVLFVGHIEHGELPKYLHISDVFVRPSLSEGLGISFIEAMAAGVPVVATEVGGITDFL
ncbi:glycosyltransferase family 4 protein, partial [bacterium]|nr:glycosyltransferase family 4 protein [bacterium]